MKVPVTLHIIRKSTLPPPTSKTPFRSQPLPADFARWIGEDRFLLLAQRCQKRRSALGQILTFESAPKATAEPVTLRVKAGADAPLPSGRLRLCPFRAAGSVCSASAGGERRPSGRQDGPAPSRKGPYPWHPSPLRDCEEPSKPVEAGEVGDRGALGFQAVFRRVGVGVA